MIDTPKRTNIHLAIVKNAQGKVLIIKRLHTERASDEQMLTWAFPGGNLKLEEGQSVEDRLAYEVKLETGFNIEIKKKISERDYQLPFVHLSYYSAELKDFKVKPIQSVHTIEASKWVEPADLMTFFTSDLDTGVQKYLGLADSKPVAPAKK